MFKENPKAFTIAEIVIALTLIGVIASMTVPSLRGNIAQAQYRTAYKKAWTNVYNIAKSEAATGGLPQNISIQSQVNFFKTLAESLEVKEFVNQTAAPFDKTTLYTDTYKWERVIYGSGDTVIDISTSKGTTAYENHIKDTNADTTKWSPWIVTPDKVAYTIRSGTSCNAYATSIDHCWKSEGCFPSKRSCIVIGVDVNGLREGPNMLEPQVATYLKSGVKMNRFTGDRFYMYLAQDGLAEGGPKAEHVGARIINDMP